MSSVTTDVNRKFINPFGDLYPDDQTDKEIFLQENPSDGHVLLRWMNGTDDVHRYTQILHLTGQPGKYAFYTPQVKIHSDQSLQQNVYHSVGTFTRAQRDGIIKLAAEVEFERTSSV
ncbi:hypothetical protein C8Q77DRAFT_357703 [Trametes polyzona]|nr:hypothetical protein C8Q77DRAFT_357703 [Trametes polyzona]